MYCLRPASTCVEQLLARALRDVANGALGGIDAAEGELLSGVVAGLFEGVVAEAPAVAVVMLDSHAVLSGEGLEGVFGPPQSPRMNRRCGGGRSEGG